MIKIETSRSETTSDDLPTKVATIGSMRGANVREAVLQREIAYLLRDRAESLRLALVTREAMEATRGELAAAVEVLSATTRENAELVVSLASSRTEVSALTSAVAYRAHVLSVVYQTRSWRMTGPLRDAANVVRRLLGRQIGKAPLSEASQHSSSAVMPMTAFHVMSTVFDSRGALIDDTLAMPHGSWRREMLVAADMLPLFDQSAGGLRLKTLLGMMGELGWATVFCSLTKRESLPGVLSTPSGVARYEEVLQQLGVTKFLYGPDEISNHLALFGRDLHFAFLSFPHVAEALMPMVRSYCPSAKVAYDMVDFHAIRMAREAMLRNDEALMLQADRQREIEIACARSADVTFAVNEEEKQILLTLASDVVVDVLPTVFEIPETGPAPLAGRADILFIGGFWHRPNSDAILWFVDRIWPGIHREAPNVVLHIVGSNPGDEVLALADQQNIEVLGFVPDVAALLDSHRVSIAPLRWGAGTKGKVGQALAFGLPVVATNIGAEGMGLKDGEHLLVADDDEGFAKHVLALLHQDHLWEQLSKRGRSHMQKHFSTGVVKENLKAALNG